MTETVETEEALRAVYDVPTDRARRKCLTALDGYCRTFIELSPFLCIGTSGSSGADVSPRGDAPGFVHIVDDRTLLIPDRPGNNRLDTMANVLANPRVGLLFMVPGIDETLRVNGRARIVRDDAALAPLAVNGKAPKSGLMVEIDEAFLHCGKALMRSRLWKEDYRVERSRLPSLGTMVNEQIGKPIPNEDADRYVENAYKTTLY
jgi:PPOX class probable FMN-dependent enzyme